MEKKANIIKTIARGFKKDKIKINFVVSFSTKI